MPEKNPVFGTTKRANWKPTHKDTILCNGNRYTPESDDLIRECTKVAKMQGMKSFVIKMNGKIYNDPKELPTNSIEALILRPEVVDATGVMAEVKTAQDVAA
jgi:hypothetical protein